MLTGFSTKIAYPARTRIADRSVDLIITDPLMESNETGFIVIITATKSLSSMDMLKFLSLN
jgi:hypothetical protein